MIGGLLAAWTNDASEPAYPKELYVNGAPVLKQRGSTAAFGVPIDSIVLIEQAEGGVSSLSFRLEDPTQVFAPNPSGGFRPGSEVRLWDVTYDRPQFTGFIQTFSPERFGLGTAYNVTCIGVEALLDWMKVPALTIASGTDTGTAIQAAVAAATGIGVPLRALYNTTWSLGQINGSQAIPIGNLGDAGGNVAQVQTTVTISQTTLREAIRLIIAQSNVAASSSHGVAAVDGHCTVDFYYGLRIFGNSPGDYASFTVTDTIAGTFVAADVRPTVDGTGIVRGVYVVGGNAAATLLVPDGSGVPGEIAILTDSTLTTAADAEAAGLAYLADKSATYRGQYTVEVGQSQLSGNIRAGSATGIIDNQVGSYSGIRIGSIQKTFSGGGAQETWVVTFGGLPPSFVSKVRRLTRSTLS